MSLPLLRRTLVYAALPLTASLAGCALDTPSDEDCFRGKCDSGSDVRSQLDGLDEPIADWLRASPMDRDGILETNYLAAMEQLAIFSGCAMNSLKTFVINDDLVEGTPFPRLVSTLCSNDENKASALFVAASFSDPNNPDDVDARNLEMFAWDKTQMRNVFYLLRPVKGSETQVQVEVEPKSCEQCHRNSNSLDDVGMPMVPIMNELVTPWPHWNSEPDFPSHSFEIPERVKASPTFAALTAGGRLGAAADLEKLIRAQQTNRVIPERLKIRREAPASIEAAMALLRPLYCNEQVNYVTEDHGSSVLPVEAVVGGGIRELFLAVRATDWPWPWLNDGRMRFASSSEERITMIPVRGNLDVEYIRRLVAVRAISAEAALRVAALDWTKPVFSDFRCNLWKDARARLRKNPVAITSDMRNVALLPILYDEIMKIDGEVSLVVGADSGTSSDLVVLADAEADAAELRSALAENRLGATGCAGTTGFCKSTMNGFGDLLDSRVKALENGGREELLFSATRRFCIVRQDFPNRPSFPRGSCEDGPRNAPKSNESSEEGLEDLLAAAVGTSDEVRLIPDGSAEGIASSLEVPPGDTTIFVGALRLRVQIDHSWRGDLSLILRAPDGAEMPVVAFDADDSANDVDDVFHVFGFAGEMHAAGTWTLVVIDGAGGERGHLLGWSLGVNTEAPELVVEGTRTAPR